MKNFVICICALVHLVNRSAAQSTFDQSRSNQFIIDALEIKSDAFSPYLHTSQKLLSREGIVRMVDSFPMVGANLSKVDYFNMNYLQADNPDFTLAEAGKSKNQRRALYTEKSALYHVNSKDFDLYINPVLDLQIGTDSYNSKKIYTNTRGIEVRGAVSKKVGFYSLILENQYWAPQYVQNYIINHRGTLPGAGFVKPFKKSQFNNAYDFFNSRGYITFTPVKNISMQFGQDRNFIGNGYRTFILSDWANEYPFLKIQTKVWKIQYQNLFAKLSHFNGFTVGSAPQDKYMALHHLSYNITKRLNIGFFESVIFERTDSNQKGGFDIAYLNPVIFYRSVEHNNNSSDNQTLGMDWKWNFKRHFSLYGQVVLDEFLFKDLVKQNGKWTNKYAIQAGLKYIDVFNIHNLNWQIEGNMSRPYTFTHFRPSTNYAHYGMPLAHPLGANFKELVNIIRWQPMNRLFVSLKNIFIITGLDSGTTHYGSNIFADYHQRIFANKPNYSHSIGQGIHTTINFTELSMSYMLKHNLFFDLNIIYRIQKSDLSVFTNSATVITAGIRLNMFKRDYGF